METFLLQEPLIEFADDFLCEDPKKGIETTGFYSLSNKSHKSQIQYSVIGTKKEIQLYQEWMLNFNHPIESTSSYKLKLNSEVNSHTGEVSTLFEDEDFHEDMYEDYSDEAINKKAHPDFPGFTLDSCFKCEFLNNDEDNYAINSNDFSIILKSEKPTLDKFNEIVQLYVDAYSQLVEEIAFGRPDIIVIVISADVFKKLATVKFFQTFKNLRRKLKASILSLKLNVPVQLILEDTINGSKKSLQDLATIGWNYCIAQYYKTANCLPWTIKDIDADTCYLGISFHKSYEDGNNHLRSSIAQAFNKDGKGLVFTGKQFEWRSEQTKVVAPHLRYDYAKELVKNVLNQYKLINKHTPKRVVIHKTTDFWDSIVNEEYDEVNGLIDGIYEELGESTEFDLVTIKSSKIKLLRNGDYPVMRGTGLKINDEKAILYTNGYIPYYDTYPGSYVPVPLSVDNIGETPIKEICKEIMALTKMNFNNSDYCDGLPITLQFSKKVGEIIQYFPSDLTNPPNKYYYYM